MRTKYQSINWYKGTATVNLLKQYTKVKSTLLVSKVYVLIISMIEMYYKILYLFF
jgi:hypothetical protein